MLIQAGTPWRAPQVSAPPVPPPAPHHDHGWTGAALHAGHDVAMVGMALPGGHQHGATISADLCTSAPAPDPHAGHHPGHPMPDPHAGHGNHAGHGGASPFSANNLLAGLSATVALGSAYHGVQMLASDDPLTRLEGGNHLLMSAGCGVMAAQMATGSAALAPWSTGLMAAHGLGEVALGLHQVATAPCVEHRNHGLTKAAHGGCLAAAQFLPGLALPLYVGMAAATAVDIVLAA